MSVNSGPQCSNPQPENVAPGNRPVKLLKDVATQTMMSARPEPSSGWYAPFAPYVPVARGYSYGRAAPYPMLLRTAPVPPPMHPWYESPYVYPINYPVLYSSNPFYTQNR